jgi:hypothetical protein
MRVRPCGSDPINPRATLAVLFQRARPTAGQFVLLNFTNLSFGWFERSTGMSNSGFMA